VNDAKEVIDQDKVKAFVMSLGAAGQPGSKNGLYVTL